MLGEMDVQIVAGMTYVLLTAAVMAPARTQSALTRFSLAATGRWR